MASPAAPLIRAVDRVTRPPILTVFAALEVLLILVVAGGYLATRRPPAETGGNPGTGDFLAFFVGGTLVREGRGHQLYDFDVQRAVHDSVLGEPIGTVQRYLNPPALAVALAPATALGYVPAFLLFTLAMAAALTVGVVTAGRALPGLRDVRWGGATAVLLTVGYLPVALTMFGGQNTVLTLALLAGVYGGLRSGHPVAAGVFTGLLTYKPQFAILPGLVLLVQREGRAVAAAVAVGLAHYGVGALVAGPDWPLHMLRSLAAHVPRELVETGPQQFSFATIARLHLPSPAGDAVAVAVALGAVALVVWGAWTTPADDPRFPAFFGFLVAAGMAASPHLQYYEAGLFPLVVILALETRVPRRPPGTGARVLLAVAYLSFPAYRLGRTTGVQPLVVVLAGLLAWTLHLTAEGSWGRRSEATSMARPG